MVSNRRPVGTVASGVGCDDTSVPSSVPRLTWGRLTVALISIDRLWTTLTKLTWTMLP